MATTAEVVFVDSRINNIAALMAGLTADTQLVILDTARDGIEQIAIALEGITNLDAIHIVSHGADGMVYLGDSVLSSANLAQYIEALAGIGASLTRHGDILLYGCDVAATAKGETFLQALADYTQADIAASTDATGSAARDGNWLLEAATGTIEITGLSPDAIALLLSVTNGDDNANNLVGTVNDDFITGLGGDDTIEGGAGLDTAIYSGSSEGYSFAVNGEKLIVTDTIPANGSDGVDQLGSVEAIQFLDGKVSVGSLGEFQGAISHPNSQGFPAVATLANGGFVLTWQSVFHVNQTNSTWDIFSRRYDANGLPVGSEFLVNSFIAGEQSAPMVATLGNGGFVVTWQSYWQVNGVNADGDVYAQRYDASGNALGGEFLINTQTAQFQGGAAITAMPDSGFVITWTSSIQDGSGNGVYAQRFDAAGVALGSEFRVNSFVLNSQQNPAIASLSDGSFVVAWQSFNQTPATPISSRNDIYARRYDANGSQQGAEFLVNAYITSEQQNPAIAALDNGGFVVAWESLGQDGDNLGIYAQRFGADGTPLGAEFRVNSYTTSMQSKPVIAALSDGGFVIGWESFNQDGVLNSVHGQSYDANGVAQSGEFRISGTTTNEFRDPAITGLSDGGFVVTGGRNAFDGHGQAIYAIRYTGAGDRVAGILSGDDSANNISWGGGQPIVLSTNGGSDTLTGGLGNDLLDGGSSGDTALFTSAFRKYALNGNPLGTATISGPDGSDTLTSIEKLQFIDGFKSYDAAASVWQIQRLYGSAFDRAADVLGLNYHAGRLDGGTALNAVAQDFAGSAEFIATYGSLSNSGFVSQLYLNVLNRLADAGGLAYWTAQLDSGAMTRGAVLGGFSESGENITNYAPQQALGLWDIDESAASVARLYMATFDRSPDAGGLGFWTSQLKTGAQTLVSEAGFFVASPEFQSTYGSLNNGQFINQLYLNVLDRAADAGGLGYWTGQLDSGAQTRAQVLTGFSESAEHIIKTVGMIDNGIVVL